MPESKIRPRWLGALMAAMAITAATAVMGGWLHLQMASQQADRPAGTFDLNQAMELAGAEVPPEIESFYFFILEREAPDESTDLADKLGRAADEHDFVGIVGADAKHNRKVLLAALAAASSRTLGGLVIIYVGPPEHEAELAAAISASGAELRFVPYTLLPVAEPAPPQETI